MNDNIIYVVQRQTDGFVIGAYRERWEVDEDCKHFNPESIKITAVRLTSVSRDKCD